MLWAFAVVCMVVAIAIIGSLRRCGSMGEVLLLIERARQQN